MCLSDHPQCITRFLALQGDCTPEGIKGAPAFKPVTKGRLVSLAVRQEKKNWPPQLSEQKGGWNNVDHIWCTKKLWNSSTPWFHLSKQNESIYGNCCGLVCHEHSISQLSWKFQFDGPAVILNTPEASNLQLCVHEANTCAADHLRQLKRVENYHIWCVGTIT